MKKTNNINDFIIFPDGKIQSIYFPSELPENGGSCAYATKECLENCPSSLVTNEHEQRSHDYFKQCGVKKITEKLLQNLRARNTRVLQWFAWGDCLPELTEKISQVIVSLHKLNIRQFGFTRNRGFWEKLPCACDLRIGLSVDNPYESSILSHEHKKLVCWPDFESSQARLFWAGRMVTKCSGWWCTWLEREITQPSDCSLCYSEGEGCFTKRVSESIL